MYLSLLKEDADIVLTHLPPYGLGDLVVFPGGTRHIGSFALLSYVRAESPSLLLCGHSGARFAGKDGNYSSTVVINPGSFGAPEGKESSRTFSEIEFDGNYVSAARLHQVKGKDIVQLNEVKIPA